MNLGSGDRFVLGVDGGGSKTEAVLARVADHEGVIGREGGVEVIATSIAGPSNLQREPFADSVAQVDQACEQLLDANPAARGSIAAACFAMAGSRNAALCDQFRDWIIRRGWTSRIEIVHDARPLIAEGTRADCGIAIIAGTGSFAYARTSAGREWFCGGWGRLIGDEGSAYWLAIEGLRHALHAADARGPRTRLLADLGDWLGGDPPIAWPKRIAGMMPNEIATAATIVTRVAETGDMVASRLVLECATHLARMITTLQRQQFAGMPVEVAVAGGLLCGSPSVHAALLDQLDQQETGITHITRVPHPSHGAAKLAARASAVPM